MDVSTFNLHWRRAPSSCSLSPRPFRGAAKAMPPTKAYSHLAGLIPTTDQSPPPLLSLLLHARALIIISESAGTFLDERGRLPLTARLSPRGDKILWLRASPVKMYRSRWCGCTGILAGGEVDHCRCPKIPERSEGGMAMRFPPKTASGASGAKSGVARVVHMMLLYLSQLQ